jgi:hypothetical protein
MGPIIDCPSAWVVDGDSLRFGGERLRQDGEGVRSRSVGIR